MGLNCYIGLYAYLSHILEYCCLMLVTPVFFFFFPHLKGVNIMCIRVFENKH